MKLTTFAKNYIDKVLTCLVLLYFNLDYIALSIGIVLILESIICLIVKESK